MPAVEFDVRAKTARFAARTASAAAWSTGSPAELATVRAHYRTICVAAPAGRTAITERPTPSSLGPCPPSRICASCVAFHIDGCTSTSASIRTTVNDAAPRSRLRVSLGSGARPATHGYGAGFGPVELDGYGDPSARQRLHEQWKKLSERGLTLLGRKSSPVRARSDTGKHRIRNCQTAL